MKTTHAVLAEWLAARDELLELAERLDTVATKENAR